MIHLSKMENVFRKPRKYKNMLIYPIRLTDYDEFESNISCLLYDRKRIADVRILKMSYLKFLIDVVFASIDDKGNQIYGDVIDQLKNILKLSFKEDYIEFGVDNTGKKILIYIGNHIVKENDFEKIRRIICEINDIDISDSFLLPEVEEELIKAQNIKNQIEIIKSATLEERIFSYHIYSGISLSEIQEYSIYQFKKCMERVGLLVEYEIFKPLEVSGQIKLKSGEIKDWLAHVPPMGRYDDVMIDKKKVDRDFRESGLTK